MALPYLTALFLFLSAVAGGGIVLTIRKRPAWTTKVLLAFSGSYLLGISVLELLPYVYTSPGPMGLFVLGGFLVQLILEFLSKGLEHGHIHHKEAIFPWSIFLSLCLHAFLEGMPLSHPDHDLARHLLFGILLHKIPIAITLVSLLMASFPNKTKTTWTSLIIFALMAPAGSLLGHWLGRGGIQDLLPFFEAITAVVAGIILHVSTTILFESSEHHRFNLLKSVSVLTGFLLAWSLTG